MKRGALALVVVAGVAHARPDKPAPGEMYRFAQGEKVESLASAGGNFRVWFTRAGTNAVAADDADKNGQPDYVEETAALYEQVLAFHRGLGFRAPVSDGKLAQNGGDARFDVYLLDFAGRGDGSFRAEGCDGHGVCTGFMVQENDFTGYPYPSRSVGARVLASHEFFHAVQAAYDNREGSVLGEGTAVWATEKFDPTLDDFESLCRGYFMLPDRSLDKPLPGPVDSFSYGTAIFFQFLDEKYGTRAVRGLWERAVGDATWFAEIDAVLAVEGATFADAFFEFARWNLFTSRRADPKRGYARGAGYPLVRIDPEKLPLAIASLRVFPASSIYYKLQPGSRGQVGAALVATEGVDPSALRVAVVARRGDKLDPIAVPASGGSVTTEAAGADEVIVLVVNTARTGESARPALCAGSPSEIASCRERFAPSPPPDMMGPPADEPPPTGGCSLGGRADRGAWSLFAIALLLLAARRVTAVCCRTRSAPRRAAGSPRPGRDGSRRIPFDSSRSIAGNSRRSPRSRDRTCAPVR